MTREGVTVLCTGDLHLGRHPARLPSELDGPLFSSKTVWRSTVESAIDRSVDAVLISGDIIDRANRYYEAFGAFEAGASMLAAEDIPLILVAGNHDFDTLPNLIESIDHDNITLLGNEGTWERHTVSTKDTTFHIDGWSFPHEHVHKSPLNAYDLERVEDPVFGLLHADFDTRESDYGPVARADLEATPPDAWLLGHIHAPGIRADADPLIFYPGSPQPLDPGEPGPHGPWLLEYRHTGEITTEQLPLATVRYDELTLQIEETDEPTAIPGRVQDTVDTHIQEGVDTHALELLSVRLRVTGRTEHHREFIRQRPSIEEQLQFKQGTVDVRVEKLLVDTEPALDLEELATGDTPVAYLAQLLIDLEDMTTPEDDRVLFGHVNDAIQEAYSSNAYTPLRREGRITDPEQELARELVEQQARALLHELVAQRETEQ